MNSSQPELIPLYLFHPEFLNICKALFVGNIVDHDDTLCSSIVSACNGSELLLPSGVPNLQFDDTTVDRDGSEITLKYT